MAFSTIQTAFSKGVDAAAYQLNKRAGGLNPANYNKNPLRVAADAYQPSIDSAKATGCELMNSVMDIVTFTEQAELEMREKPCKGARARTF